MTNGEIAHDAFSRRPKRADARRNYEKLVDAAREAFAEGGVSASLEDIARRAGVGIGTLYRHFPTRQRLLESVYVDEVDALCRLAGDLAVDEPWDALVSWLHRFVRYMATKRALLEGLHDHRLLCNSRDAVLAAGEPLLLRAQQAGAARTDATFDDVIRLVMGITAMNYGEPDHLDRVLRLGLDGLRPRPNGE